jgi:eukaryotic-like serine/threonine-protein kinase
VTSRSPQTLGSYVLREEIAKGGMSRVYRAEGKAKDGTPMVVAVKRMLPSIAANKDLRASFIHEGKLTQCLRHPNIAQTFEAGRSGDTYFIVMEYVPGPTLKELVDHCNTGIGLAPIPVLLHIAYQICDALDHAHNGTDEHGKPLGIVHRDVSPSNVILSPSGLAKLIDFGLAKAKMISIQTDEGIIKGKFNYVAPEYLSGQLDARVDLWAIGVVMHEVLSGRRLFNAPDDFETVSRVKKLPIPRPSIANPEVSATLDEIVMTALERNPARRWQTAAHLREALKLVIDRPEHTLTNEQVSKWVTWAMAQPAGMTVNGAGALKNIVDETRPASEPTPTPEEPPKRPSARWLKRILTPRSRE